MLRLLVSGGLGFIGSNFCRYILDVHKDWEVVNLDKVGLGANFSSVCDLEKNSRYSFVRGDICDLDLLCGLVGKVDGVVNFAAETHVDRSIVDPFLFLQNNVVGTFNVVEAIRKVNCKVRFVQVSTDEVYGSLDVGSFCEADALSPSSPYSASKAGGDMFVLSYCKTFGLNGSITRCTNNFGPFQMLEKLIPKVIVRAFSGLKVPVYGCGGNVRDWLFVLDHCRAVEAVFLGGLSGEVYNVSAGNEFSNLEIVGKILNLLGKDESFIEFVEDRPGHDVRYSLDSSKLSCQLGWVPKFGFDEALKATVEWYLANQNWWSGFATEEILHPTPWKISGNK